jgi:pimeloyl-ACP methyl ester carboxylesterase
MTERVVLVPGLWMPAAVMALLGARLARHGYAVSRFRYPSRRPIEGSIESLARFAREHAAGGARLHFVGHSLGGVLIFDMLARHPDVPAASAVLLGAPVRGSLAGRRFGVRPFGRWMMGASRPLWESRHARWARPAPLGVIAGTVALGLGRAVGGRLPGENDGVVRLEETEVEGMTARVMVPLGHSVLIVSRRVAELVAHFLAHGRFP